MADTEDAVTLEDLDPGLEEDTAVEDVQSLFRGIDDYLATRGHLSDSDESDEEEDQQHQSVPPDAVDASLQTALHRAVSELRELREMADQTIAELPTQEVDGDAGTAAGPMDNLLDEEQLRALQERRAAQRAADQEEREALRAARTQLQSARAARAELAVHEWEQEQQQQQEDGELMGREAAVVAEELEQAVQAEAAEVEAKTAALQRELEELEQQRAQEAAERAARVEAAAEALAAAEREEAAYREQLERAAAEEAARALEEERCERIQNQREMANEDERGRLWRQKLAEEKAAREALLAEQERARKHAEAVKKQQQELEAARRAAAEEYEKEQARLAAEAKAAAEAEARVLELKRQHAERAAKREALREDQLIKVHGRAQGAPQGPEHSLVVQLKRWQSQSSWPPRVHSERGEELQQQAASWPAGQVGVLELCHEEVCSLTELSHFPHLVGLNMAGNHVESLQGLQSCPGLAEVALPDNRVASLQGLSGQLTSLSLERNQLESLEGMLPSLHTLRAGENQIRALGGSLRQCAALSHLEIQRNALSELPFGCLPDSITHLDASANQIAALEPIKGLPLLCSLALYGNHISQLSPECFNHAVLKHVWLNGNGLTRLPPLGFCPLLQSLHLNDNQLSALAPLSSCPLLHTLDLSFNLLNSLEHTLAALAPCAQLRKLSLNDNPLSELPGYRAALLSVSGRLEELDSTPVPPGELLAAADGVLRRRSLVLASFFFGWRMRPWQHLAVAERPASQLSHRSRPALLLSSRVAGRRLRPGAEASLLALSARTAAAHTQASARWKGGRSRQDGQPQCVEAIGARVLGAQERHNTLCADLESLGRFDPRTQSATFHARPEYSARLAERGAAKAAEEARLMEEQRRAEEEAQSRARAEAAERELRERLAQEAARAEEERRLAEQHRAQQEAERVAKQEADRRAEAERRAKEQAAKEAHELLERTRAQERLAAEQREAEHRAASSLAAVQLQRVVRGNIVRTRLRKARERAAFVDDDEYDYGGVDEDFLPDISGLDFSSELLMPKPCSPARPRSSNSGHRIVIDTTAMAPRGAPSPRGSLMVLPEEGPPIPGPPHPPAAWGEQAWQAAVVHEEEQAVHEPLTHRSEVSEVGSVSSTGSRVASRLREAISDWGFQDPNVARTFAARRRKMAKQQRDATRRRDEKDPAKRLEKFRHNQGALSKANGTQAKPAWMQPPPDHDDDNMSVHSFATEEIPATPDLSFHSAAPNRKLVRSQGEVAEARRGRVVPTQHVVLSNNFLPGSR